MLAKPSTATARSAADKVRRIVARSQLPDDKVFGELDLIERLRALALSSSGKPGVVGARGRGAP